MAFDPDTKRNEERTRIGACSARDLTSDLFTAGNQAVALKTGNLDVQTRLDAIALKNRGENERAVLGARFGHSLTPRRERVGVLQRQVDALRRPAQDHCRATSSTGFASEAVIRVSRRIGSEVNRPRLK